MNSTVDVTGATVAAAGWADINVTTGVAAISAGSANNGWRLVSTAGATANKKFNSSRFTTNTTLRPKLTVT